MSRLAEIELPNKALQECVAISGIAAVCVVAEPAGGCIFASSDPESIHRDGIRILWLAWCQSRDLAEQIADDASRKSVAKPEDAIRAIEAAASQSHAKLTEHASVMQRLQQALDHVTSARSWRSLSRYSSSGRLGDRFRLAY